MEIKKLKYISNTKITSGEIRNVNLFGNKEGIKNKWKEHVQELLRHSFGQETENVEIHNTSVQNEGEVKLSTL